MGSAFRWFLVLIVLAIAGYGAFAFLWGVPSVEQRATLSDEAAIERGKYLAAAGDCVSCHTAEGGETFAGGRPFETPFGRLYSTNITPNVVNGIGGMTSGQFYQLLAFGADSVLHPLYPAMPYTSFHLVSRDDSDALHAFFMSLAPIDATAKSNDLRFPFNIRPLMFGWNFLYAKRTEFSDNQDKDAVWNRGAYLVEGLGHCGECHTPRNVFGATEADKALSGAAIGGLQAPDIRAEILAENGWTRDDLVLYFETGASPQGTAIGDMFPVVKNSLRFLTHADRVAIATFLVDGTGDQPSKGDEQVSAMADVAHENTAGQSLYVTFCGSCHGPQGLGIANTMPALKGNATLAEARGANLIQVVANGINPQTLNLDQGYGPMPAYGDRMTSDEMAALANYVRAEFAPEGSALPILSEGDVTAILKDKAQ